eukprot:SAG22_NODE_751_length_7449_cov_14.062721_4_plen_193_part_00
MPHLGVLGGHGLGGTVRAAENDRAGDLTPGHVVGLGSAVDNLIDGLHREVPRHELADGLEALERRADGDAGEAGLCDRRVDDALGPELVVKPFGDLVGPVVLADLLADHEDRLVLLHLLLDGRVQRVAHRQGGEARRLRGALRHSPPAQHGRPRAADGEHGLPARAAARRRRPLAGCERFSWRLAAARGLPW